MCKSISKPNCTEFFSWENTNYAECLPLRDPNTNCLPWVSIYTMCSGVSYCNVLQYYVHINFTGSGTRIIIGSVAGAIALLVVLISALVIVCCLISKAKGKAKGN